MWSLYRKATLYHKLPSEVFGEEDPLAAWMVDNAMTWFGTTIENMLQEVDHVGEGANRQSLPRYTLSQLLDPTYKFPREDNDSTMPPMQGIAGIMFDEVK